MFLSFPKPRHKSSSHMKEPEPTQPDSLLSFNKTSVSTTVTTAYWVTSERGHKRKVSSCPAIRKWCLPVLPPIQNMGQRGSWLLQRKQGRRLFHVLWEPQDHLISWFMTKTELGRQSWVWNRVKWSEVKTSLQILPDASQLFDRPVLR